ncbi:DUF3078 domain-containing protein [Thermophagus sp. OGC60D27]|uniref:DUF3078 domain-containing protein n=1 Tax=Thermophagus sp. OGC60D27 TaxID=3458415 RepID=UPI004037A4B1
MKNLIVILSAITIISFPAFSQSETDTIRHWKSGGSSAFTFSQVSLTNWSAGGENSVSGTFLFNTFMNYKKGKIAWENTLDIGYGLTKQGSENMIKTEDRLQLVSKYGYQASQYWYYTALADFKTQLGTGYKDPPENSILTSKFLAPAYLLLSLGMDYKPSENFSLYLSPLTSKWTIVNDEELSQQGAFGVDPGKKIRTEFGASIKSILKKENIIENVDFMTRLDLFSNYTNNPLNIDVEWETKFDFRVNSFLSANLGTTLLYDDDIKYISDEGVERGARIQFKQLFGFGINFKF